MNNTWSRLLAAIFVAPILRATGSWGLSTVEVTLDAAGYSISVNGAVWLRSSPLRVCANGTLLSTSDGSLIPLGSVRAGRGIDSFGQHDFTTISYGLATSRLPVISIIAKSFATSQAVTLSAVVESAIRTCDISLDGAHGLTTAFPAFDTQSASQLTAMSWEDAAAGVNKVSDGLSGIGNSGVNAGPVVLFNRSDDAALIWSTADNHKNIGQSTGNSSYAAGVVSKLVFIPPGWNHTVLFFAADGITATVYGWGQHLQRARGREILWGTDTWRTPTDALTKLGYFTDNGAYYYEWPPMENSSRPWSAEVGLLKVKQQLDSQKIPIHYMQLDDWWYFGPFYFGNVKCVLRWEGDTSPKLFPKGIPAFQKSLGIPLMLYTPFWCGGKDGAEFDTPFPMVNSTTFPGTKIVTPEGSYCFFSAVLEQGAKLANGFANFQNYEIDFLGNNFEGMLGSAIKHVDDADKWYRGLADAAEERGVSVQYCLAYPSDILISLDFPSVSNARASNDYCMMKDDSNVIGVAGSSLLMGALKMGPSKDVFWTTAVQPMTACDQQHEYAQQPHVEFDTLLAVMSLGPVAFGDALGYTNSDLIMRTCSSDGTLLRPDRPLSRVDSSYKQGAETGKAPLKLDVRATHAAQGSSLWAYYIVAYKLSQSYVLRRYDLFPTPAPTAQFGVYKFPHQADPVHHGCEDGTDLEQCILEVETGALPTLAPTASSPEGFDFWMVVPKMAGRFYILGELSKFTALSRNRIAALTATEQAVFLSLRGSAGEAVAITVVDSVLRKVAVKTAVLDEQGRGTLTFGSVDLVI